MDMEALISKKQIGLKLVEMIRDHILGFLALGCVLLPIRQYVLLPIEQYVLAQIKYYLLTPMRLRLRFLLDYNRNMENLRTELEKLSEKRDEVQRLVNAAARGEVILPRVQKWQNSAMEIAADPMKLLDGTIHLNPMSRYQRSKSAKEKTAEVNQLIQKGSSFDRVTTLESRKRILEQIIEALKHDQTNRIGILGVAGVGKTFLAKEIYEEAKDIDGDPFEEVVMTTVSRHPDPRRILLEIAGQLGLSAELSTTGIARRLAKIFNGKKRILIILDDIHQNFELEAVGIHFTERYKGCKIVLVFQSQHVCYHFCTEMDFPIEALDEEEKWILFQKMAGVPVHHQNPLAVEVARNCAGLPRDIIIAATAWRRNAARNF